MSQAISNVVFDNVTSYETLDVTRPLNVNGFDGIVALWLHYNQLKISWPKVGELTGSKSIALDVWLNH